MRSCALPLLCAVLMLTLAFPGSALAAAPGPTSADLQRQISELSAHITDLEAEVDALRARLQDIEAGAPAERISAEAELADLIAAAEREAAIEKAPAGPEETALPPCRIYS